MARISFTAGADAAGMRLDTFVPLLPEGINRSRLKSGLQSVTINGRSGKLSYLLKSGDRVEIEWEDPAPSDILPEDIPLDILYEDEAVTVLNKRQGMVTHPAAGNWKGTLVHALLFRWGRSCVSSGGDSSAAIRPGIVHRLDKDTSGAIITARTPESAEWLRKQFHDRRVKKVYAAILCGVPPSAHGSIKTRIVRDPRNRKRFTCTENPDKGKFAHTVYRCMAVYGGYSLVLLKLKTGRTHQLRVHMKYIGCPILGDPVYGRHDGLFDSATLMLHAKTLGIRLPGSGDFSVFEAPVPPRFRKVIRKLRESWSRRKPGQLEAQR